jgi:flavorubredoxin
MEEASKYYANILWPLSPLVIKKIEEVLKMDLKINMIAPSHGVIWRNNPTRIVESYLKWAKGESENKILVVYDTMWGSTEKMAKAMVEGIASEGYDAMLFRLPVSDSGDIIKELLTAKGLLIGSSTINNGILPTVAPFLEELVGLKPVKKKAAIFGSYGWGGGADKVIEERLIKAGIENILPQLTIKWVPEKNEIQKCVEFGKEFTKKIISYSQ